MNRFDNSMRATGGTLMWFWGCVALLALGACSANPLGASKRSPRKVSDTGQDVGLTISHHFDTVPCENKADKRASRLHVTLSDTTHSWTWVIERDEDGEQTENALASPPQPWPSHPSTIDQDFCSEAIEKFVSGTKTATKFIRVQIMQWSARLKSLCGNHENGQQLDELSVVEGGDETSACAFDTDTDVVGERLASEMNQLLASWIEKRAPGLQAQPASYAEIRTAVIELLTFLDDGGARRDGLRELRIAWFRFLSQRLSPRTGQIRNTPAVHWELQLNTGPRTWHGQGVAIDDHLVVTAGHVISSAVPKTGTWRSYTKQWPNGPTGEVTLGAIHPKWPRDPSWPDNPNLPFPYDVGFLYANPLTSDKFTHAQLLNGPPRPGKCDGDPSARDQNVRGMSYDPNATGLRNEHSTQHVTDLCFGETLDGTVLLRTTASRGLSNGLMVTGKSGSGLYTRDDEPKLFALFVHYTPGDLDGDTFTGKPIDDWETGGVHLLMHYDAIRRAKSDECKGIAHRWYKSPEERHQREVSAELERCIWPDSADETGRDVDR